VGAFGPPPATHPVPLAPREKFQSESVRHRDGARCTLWAIGTCAIGLVRYRELCQFFVCYRVGALSHRALTGPSPFDLLKEQMIEMNVVLGVISEPPRRLMETNTCFVSQDGLSAILWRPEGCSDMICRLVNCEESFVVRFGDILVTSCYTSPNAHIDHF